MTSFTFSNVDVFIDDRRSQATFNMQYHGEVYRVEAEYDVDEGWTTEVYLDGVSQIEDTHFSRTIDMDFLQEWVDDQFFFPVHQAVSEAMTAAMRKINSTDGSVAWETDN